MTTIYVTDDSHGRSCKGGWVTITNPEPLPDTEDDVPDEDES